MTASVLVIDDEPVVRELIAEILVDAGHSVVAAGSAREGLRWLDGRDVDVVVSDVVMPGLTGLQLLDEVRERRPSLPVVLVTGAGTQATLCDALAGGAAGFVMKPFSHAELQSAVATALDRATEAARDVGERLLTPTLASALANAIEARDSTLQGHCERMSALAIRLAQELRLVEREVETVRLGAILHDVGKIGIPDRVLRKRGALTSEERALMRTHPLIGDRLLEPLELLADVRPVVRHHHERWDGSGYPDGLAGAQIPLAARVVAVADAIEAMSGQRPYRVPLRTDAIVRELEEGRGTQWDPEPVDVALRLIRSGVLRFGAAGLSIVELPQPATAERRHAVLLVEDDVADALLAKEALGALEHVLVRHTSDAASAVDLCRSSTWSLVVVDESLPDATGLELIRSLRSVAPEVPVVMLTGDRSPEVAVEAFREGAADYVVKSDGFDVELSGRVRALLPA